jgi:hypothetical protein
MRAVGPKAALVFSRFERGTPAIAAASGKPA